MQNFQFGLAIAAIFFTYPFIYVQGIFTQQQTPIVASITPPFGGINGGTQITLLGANFNSSSLFTETVVYVGNDRCKVIQHYSTSSKLVCITPKCTTTTCNSGNIWTGTSTVDVRVYVSSVEGILTPTSTPTFTYHNGWTPLIYWMHSCTWGTASMPLLVRSDNVELKSIDILFDNRYHGYLGSNGELNDEALPGTSSNLLLFYRPPEDMPSGFFNLSMVVQDDFSHGSASTGIASMFDRDRFDNNFYHRFYLFQTTLQGVSHSICLFPTISFVTPKIGSIGGGTRVSIKGTGFTTIPGDLVVYVGGLPCIIESSNWDSIECRTSPKLLPSEVVTLVNSNTLISTLRDSSISMSPRNQGSPGWWFKVWDALDVWANKFEHDGINFEFGWRQKFYFSFYDFYGWNWYQTATADRMYQSAVYGFDAGSIFIAPYAGLYTFYVSSDDYSYLYASSEGMEVNEKLIAFNPAYTNNKKFFQYPKSQISDSLELRKGEKLYLRYRGVNTGGYDSFLLAVKISPQLDCSGALMHDWDPQNIYSCPASTNSSNITSPQNNFPESLLQHHAVFETQAITVSYDYHREKQVMVFPTKYLILVGN